MKTRFKVIKRKFQISNVSELSKGCRVSEIISCVVENLDSGELLKIKSKTASGLEERIINRVDEMDCEVGDIVIIRD
jgi:hypothetical protein